jgi:molecular chaperone DnaK
MKNYVGIDLGTTNSAICAYDGENVRLYKSTYDQSDVTPSAIFIDKRGQKHIGRRAYDQAAQNPGNAATKFKRFMGTSTPMKLPAVDIVMTPEECSAEILKECFGYLPEEIRNDPNTGTVITVPAAFNQMQKDATMAAAEMAGIGSVALMQEPVAAVMSEMRVKKSDGTFLVYDLGGGTLDIAIATSTKGRVNIQAHGGIAMCGGTDFDRAILESIAKPWIMDNFKLPDNFMASDKYNKLIRVALWSAEKAKISLSSKEEAIISATDTELNIQDEEGNEIYLDIPISRKEFDKLIEERINDSIKAARGTIEKAGLTANDIERIVFVGGPTQYKPLRDKVSFELGIASSTDVNPMTAVAEGAAIFAESIDWSTESRGRKTNRGEMSIGGKLDLKLSYISRTPELKAKIAVKIEGAVIDGAEFQVDSLDTGWSSGKIKLKDGAIIEVDLPKPGENTFKLFVFDSKGGPIKIEENKIIISRTAASIDAIPASSSIGIEVLNKSGGAELAYLVKEGEPLPKKGEIHFKAAANLKAGKSEALHFIIREGEIKNPVQENAFIGEFKILGTDFDHGEISLNDDLICKYEIRDSGQLQISVSVPKLKSDFDAKKTFYSRQEGQIDFTTASNQINDEIDSLKSKVQAISEKVKDEKLNDVSKKINNAAELSANETDPEKAKEAMDSLQNAKKILAEIRRSNLKLIRQMDLDSCRKFFDDAVRANAKPSEATSFDNLVKTCQNNIDNNAPEFENNLLSLRYRNWEILERQDWFVIDMFKRYSEEPWKFTDQNVYAGLVGKGNEAIKADDIAGLRNVLAHLSSIRISSNDDDDMSSTSNIRLG